jgi:hypothetical protein
MLQKYKEQRLLPWTKCRATCWTTAHAATERQRPNREAQITASRVRSNARAVSPFWTHALAWRRLSQGNLQCADIITIGTSGLTIRSAATRSPP